MSFVELPGINDVHEPKPVQEGNNYDLCIIDAKMTEKDGKNSLRFIMEIEGEPEAANVFNYVGLIQEDDDDADKKTKLLFAKRFFHQFAINVDNGIEIEQCVGARATNCKITQQEWPEGSGQMRNTFQANPLPQEAD